ncbi:YdeI/OmpD-associated family protein [soil metagenome]
MKEPLRPTIFASADAFREWLEENHQSAAELWVGYYKKGSGQTSITYPQAVEEALCFGWIDGLTKSFGDHYANRFTPRRRTSRWSPHNIARVAELTRQGRMQAAGLRAFEERDRRRDIPPLAEQPVGLPPAMEQRLRNDAAAWANWQSERPSYRRSAAGWVLDAKREETRQRRLADLIADCAAGRRIKPFRQLERDAAARIGR